MKIIWIAILTAAENIPLVPQAYGARTSFFKLFTYFQLKGKNNNLKRLFDLNTIQRIRYGFRSSNSESETEPVA